MPEDEPTMTRQVVSVAGAVRLAETYPNVALRTLFLELNRAQNDVPLGVDDREDAIATSIRARLAGGGHLPNSDQQPHRSSGHRHLIAVADWPDALEVAQHHSI